MSELYSGTESAVRCGDTISDLFPVVTGVCQGCVLPHTFQHLPATFVVTRWGDPRRFVDTAVGATRLGWPRPRRAAWWFGPIQRCLSA